MTFESEYARMCEQTNQMLREESIAVARRVLIATDQQYLARGYGVQAHGFRRLRDALADQLLDLLTASRRASTSFADTDLPVAIRSNSYGDSWVDPGADAIGQLAAALARAATMLVGTTPSDFTDESTGEWATGVLNAVRTAAEKVIKVD
ncbi:hypothetical protein [Amycolatopsis sp. TNS106]|uniref:hypothetical protein n=1 Tax=Amycolatopsis sp. TNS106 TaxID=2861750 RepID=UPI001C57139D|nr:hypothetical protein [Amycolatopsis sp. TNS106]